MVIFSQAFSETRKAYDRQDLSLTQTGFSYQTIVLATITKDGLVVDGKTGVATTADGKPTLHKSYVPSKNKTIQQNFESFYISATFVFVYDVLVSAFARAYHFRKCIDTAIATA